MDLANVAQNFNRCVAAMFPPHPCAVAPSEIARCHEALPRELRRWVNSCWGSTKQAATLAEYQSKKNNL